jgi:hypothetical protein
VASFLQELLKDKINLSTEIELHLFEFCNLNCAFCGQDHDSRTGMDRESILAKADRVIKFMGDSAMESHIVNIMGGEIFNDDVPDRVFTFYEDFYQRVNSYAEEKGLSVRFNWVTNLIFDKVERVYSFIQSKENCFISTSYDFAGRGLNLIKSSNWERNLKALSDKITVIGFVLTRPAIRKILKQEDPLFEELYVKYPLYFDYYVPERSAKKMMPSEQEMLDAFIYLAENYPKVQPIADLLNNSENRMTCYSLNKLTLLPNNREVKCRYMEYDSDDFHSPIDYSSNENIIEAHLERSGCLGCEWFDRCMFRCFVQADWAGLERLPDCLFRLFFNHCESKKLLKNL